MLVGGVGYTNLHDMSVGPTVVDRLKSLRLPTNVEVDDLNHLIAAYQRLSQEKYDKIILVGSVKRGRKPGTVDIYQYGENQDLPDDEEIRIRVAEGVSGTVNLDSVLILCRYYRVLPQEVLVIEVEPQDENWGEGFTPPVEKAIEEVIGIVLEEARAADSEVRPNA